MRRGRILTGVALLVAAVSLSGAPSALAATPQEICSALQAAQAAGQDPSAVFATYSAADQAAFASDPTIQGYGCAPIIVPPPAQTCVEGGNGSNGGTPGAPGTPGSNGEQCGSTPAPAPNTNVPLTPAVQPSAPAVVAGVAGTRKTIVVNAKPAVKPAAKPTPQAQVLGAKSPTKSAVAPVAVTRKRGTLPFTGAELGLFALVGLALVGSGVLLRTTARQREREQS